jgi:hypothetical protein
MDFKDELLSEQFNKGNIKLIEDGEYVDNTSYGRIILKDYIETVYNIKKPFIVLEIFPPLRVPYTYSRTMKDKVLYRLKKDGYKFVGKIGGWYVKEL